MLAVSAATFSLEGVAHASDDVAPNAPSPSPERRPRIAWGVRLNGSVGYAAISDDGAAVRVGVDGEYWLSKNVGVGVQLGLERLGSKEFPDLAWCTGQCSGAGASRTSFAPAITVRASNPTSFPILSLALGYAWGHSEAWYQDDSDPSAFSSWSSDAAVPYASLTGAWLFHAGPGRPGSGAFAWGPLVHLDGFPFGDSASGALYSGSFAWVFTVGVTLGLGVAGDRGE